MKENIIDGNSSPQGQGNTIERLFGETRGHENNVAGGEGASVDPNEGWSVEYTDHNDVKQTLDKESFKTLKNDATDRINQALDLIDEDEQDSRLTECRDKLNQWRKRIEAMDGENMPTEMDMRIFAVAYGRAALTNAIVVENTIGKDCDLDEVSKGSASEAVNQIYILYYRLFDINNIDNAIATRRDADAPNRYEKMFGLCRGVYDEQHEALRKKQEEIEALAQEANPSVTQSDVVSEQGNQEKTPSRLKEVFQSTLKGFVTVKGAIGKFSESIEDAITKAMFFADALSYKFNNKSKTAVEYVKAEEVSEGSRAYKFAQSRRGNKLGIEDAVIVGKSQEGVNDSSGSDSRPPLLLANLSPQQS